MRFVITAKEPGKSDFHERIIFIVFTRELLNLNSVTVSSEQVLDTHVFIKKRETKYIIFWQCILRCFIINIVKLQIKSTFSHLGTSEHLLDSRLQGSNNSEDGGGHYKEC